jgi:hypothetical protein
LPNWLNSKSANEIDRAAQLQPLSPDRHQQRRYPSGTVIIRILFVNRHRHFRPLANCLPLAYHRVRLTDLPVKRCWLKTKQFQSLRQKQQQLNRCLALVDA